jgi:putative copper export protein
MLSPSAATLRLFLHVLAATVWVGGQLTLAGLVPGLRALGDDLPRRMARRFNRIAWPAFGVLVITGVWNLFEIDVTKQSSAYQVTLFLKLAIVAVSGISAWVHSNATTKVVLAVGGAVTGVAALASLFFGILLRTGTA